jgi:hypothetical protein
MRARMRRFGVMGLCLAVAACTNAAGQYTGPAVSLGTPEGLIPLTSNAAPPGGGLAAPPGMGGPGAPGAPPFNGDLSGNYSGYGNVTEDPVASCEPNIHMYNFRVSGRQVRFGGFHGTIEPNGALQMVFGRTWIIGRFDGPQFEGQVENGVCVWQALLTRQ